MTPPLQAYPISPNCIEGGAGRGVRVPYNRHCNYPKFVLFKELLAGAVVFVDIVNILVPASGEVD